MDRDAGAVKSKEYLDPSWEKNNYYRDGFRNMMWIISIQVVLILLLAFFLALYVRAAREPDLFFAETVEGKRMQMVGLMQPNIGKISLMNWVAQAATQIMTFDFNDIEQRFDVSRLNFTPQGWDSFHSAMVASGLVEDVIKAQQIVTSVPKAPPILLQEGVIEGKYSWVFEMPMLITFRAGSVQRAETKNVRIVVEQVPTRDNPNGLGIGEWYIY